MYFRKKRNYLKYKIAFVLMLVMVISIMTFTYIDRQIMPTVQALGELKAQDMTTRAINESIGIVLEQGIEYRDLISIKEDSEGNITLMQANTMVMNQIASDVALTIQENLKQIEFLDEQIPLGSALDSQLLAQYGPKLNLAVTPLGMVNVNFGTEFEQSGINQTRHRIYLIVNTKVRVIVPLSGSTIEVTTNVPVAETIIIGRVPQEYIYVPEDKFHNIAPIIE